MAVVSRRQRVEENQQIWIDAVFTGGNPKPIHSTSMYEINDFLQCRGNLKLSSLAKSAAWLHEQKLDACDDPRRRSSNNFGFGMLHRW
jgi:hypothetical protein